MNKKCKRLGNQATKRERKEAHRAELEMREALRMERSRDMPREWVYANLSKNHEWYGDTPSEHEKRKVGTLKNNS